ncbi:sensor histidine kinase [Streptomyces bambusae]|uniref:sensor histidine kinase n=1 Tax=Streptomyces bambusae TaxID=1550616 RepID=UPI00355837B1
MKQGERPAGSRAAVPGGVRRAAGWLAGRRARLRWVHLVLGGALLMPYFLLTSVLVGVVAGGRNALSSLPLMLVSYAVALPVVAATGMSSLVRPMSVASVRAMCGVPGEGLADGPARSGSARARAAGWWTLHLGVGALLSGMSLAVPPMAVVLMVVPFSPSLRHVYAAGSPWVQSGAGMAVAPVVGAALLVALAAVAAGAGSLLARLAPVLLGPTPADRLAAAEERAADLAVRNRLARELHDSVGHALSAVTLQAGAARRVLGSDPAFVREALAAIEETTRRTVGELDTVLGLLREGEGAHPDTAPAPTLAADLDGLLDRTRAAGIVVDATGGDWSRLPQTVSREAYRIVQEGLSNALRHGTGPVVLRITAPGAGPGPGAGGERAQERGGEERDGAERGAGETGRGGERDGARDSGPRGRERYGEGERGDVEIVMENPMENPMAGAAAAAGRSTGGRGLHGIRERAVLLGGTAEAGERDGRWRLRATLPLGGPAGGRR